MRQDDAFCKDVSCYSAKSHQATRLTALRIFLKKLIPAPRAGRKLLPPHHTRRAQTIAVFLCVVRACRDASKFSVPGDFCRPRDA